MVTSRKLSTHTRQDAHCEAESGAVQTSAVIQWRFCHADAHGKVSWHSHRALQRQSVHKCYQTVHSLSLSLCLPLKHINVRGRWPWKQWP